MGHEECVTSECYWYYEGFAIWRKECPFILSECPSHVPSLDVKTFLCFSVTQVLTLNLLVWTKVVRIQFPWWHLLVRKICFPFRVHSLSLQEYVEGVRLVLPFTGVVRWIECYEIVEMWLDRYIIFFFVCLCLLIVIDV